jgi:hypothetical protein
MDPRTPIPNFILKNRYWSPTLNFLTPILLHHSDCKSIISTPSIIPLGLYLHYQIRKFLKHNHLIRLVAFQQNTLIPLSNLMNYDKHKCENEMLNPSAPENNYDSVTPPSVNQNTTVITCQPTVATADSKDISTSSHSLPTLNYAQVTSTTHISSTPSINKTTTDLPILTQPQSLSVISPRHVLLPFPDLNSILYPKLT